MRVTQKNYSIQKNKETGNRRSTTQDQQKLNTAQTGVKPDGTYASPEERKKLFQQSSTLSSYQ